MGRKAQNNVKLLGGRPIVTGHRTGPICRTGVFGFVVGISPHDDRGALTVDHGYTNFDVETRNRL